MLLSSMRDELIKIAEEAPAYRRIKGARLDKQIPLLRSVPGGEEGRALLLAAIEASSNKNWSHPQVAVKNLSLGGLGFSPTRLAIPLPGEPIGSTSWRSGELHAHKRGPVFLVHKDATPPKGISGSIGHAVRDIPPAVAKLVKGALPSVIVEGEG